MINDASVKAVDEARWGKGFVRPLHDSYCFAQLPRLIPSLFEGDPLSELPNLLLGPLAGTYQKVILLFIDGFGWRFLERYGEQYPFLRRFVEEGTATKLTSQFPSTTLAHVTTMHTGKPVGQSGMYEWFQYEPSLDAVIAPLFFSFLGDTAPNTLVPTGIRPEQVFPRTTIYQALRRHGVSSHVFQSKAFTPSPFTNVVTHGAKLHPFSTLQEGLRDLAHVLGSERQPGYFHLYFAGIDTVGHKHGPESAEFDTEVDACFRLLESVLHASLLASPENVLVLMTADHGQIAGDPATTIFLNRLLPGLERTFQTSPQGRAMLPSGYARDLFLYVQAEHVEAVRAEVQQRLTGAAEVCLVQDLIDQHFFGTAPPSEAFTSRMGNLAVLPYDEGLVWWDSGRYRVLTFRGYHGGLAPEEMETELLALRYG